MYPFLVRYCPIIASNLKLRNEPICTVTVCDYLTYEIFKGNTDSSHNVLTMFKSYLLSDILSVDRSNREDYYFEAEDLLSA